MDIVNSFISRIDEILIEEEIIIFLKDYKIGIKMNIFIIIKIIKNKIINYWKILNLIIIEFLGSWCVLNGVIKIV